MRRRRGDQMAIRWRSRPAGPGFRSYESMFPGKAATRVRAEIDEYTAIAGQGMIARLARDR
jgi:hypothetical protein